jgi:hypothetical protein
MSEVLHPIGTIYQYVIEEDEHKLVKERAEHIVHQGFKGRRRVGQAKRHDEELKEPLVCAERCLLHVLQLHLDLVIPGAQVKPGEECCTPEFIQELLHN